MHERITGGFKLEIGQSIPKHTEIGEIFSTEVKVNGDPKIIFSSHEDHGVDTPSFGLHVRAIVNDERILEDEVGSRRTRSLDMIKYGGQELVANYRLSNRDNSEKMQGWKFFPLYNQRAMGVFYTEAQKTSG